MNLVTVDSETSLVQDVKRISKVCRMCHVDKPLAQYDAYANAADGLYHECIQCRRKASLRRREARAGAAQAQTPAETPMRVIAQTMPAASADALAARSVRHSVIVLLDLIVTELTDAERAQLLRLLQAFDA